MTCFLLYLIGMHAPGYLSSRVDPFIDSFGHKLQKLISPVHSMVYFDDYDTIFTRQ